MNLLGFVLLTVGFLVITGLAVYYFATNFFDADVPIAFKVAVPMILIGLLVLLASAIIDRYRATKTEDFKEVEK
ncbi:MAG: hypothetical protein QF579_00415 [Dehalococcoidia bacterium]|jgi:hypothetical protein|nr:hypothetical protein [Dehalococcoidia bacterium]